VTCTALRCNFNLPSTLCFNISLIAGIATDGFVDYSKDSGGREWAVGLSPGFSAGLQTTSFPALTFGAQPSKRQFFVEELQTLVE